MTSELMHLGEQPMHYGEELNRAIIILDCPGALRRDADIICNIIYSDKHNPNIISNNSLPQLSPNGPSRSVFAPNYP